MQPINYMLQAADPVEKLMQGVATGLNVQGGQQELAMNAAREARAAELHPIAMQGAEQGLGLAANQDARAQGAYETNQRAAQMEMDAAQRQQARQGEYQSALAGLAELGPNATFQDYQRVAAQFPEASEALTETWSTLDETQRNSQAEILAQGANALRMGNVDLAVQIATRYADAAENSGDAQGAAVARSMVQLIQSDPQAGLAAIGATLATLDPDMAERVFPESSTTAARVQSSETVGGRVSVQTMSDGTTRVVDVATNEVITGPAATEAIASAEASRTEAERDLNEARAGGRLDAQIEQGGQAEVVKQLAGVQAQFVESAYEQADVIATGMNNIRTAINALDEGARAGAIDRYLPNISASSAALKNAMDRMGLDVIGSVTFGALSVAELRLAMDTAVPRNLNEPELREWLSERLDAQEKVRTALLEQARFLSDPENTLQDWSDRVSGGQASPSAPPSGGTPSYLVQP